MDLASNSYRRREVTARLLSAARSDSTSLIGGDSGSFYPQSLFLTLKNPLWRQWRRQ